ncbi:DUF1926 domain-containing protein [soil metagenome]
MTRRISLALVLHNHQPVGNFGWIIEEVFGRAYEPMIGALERHPGVRVGLHYTGPLLEWMGRERPDTIQRLRALVARDQVEMLGGGLYEPILASLPERDRRGQLMRMSSELERTFGARPRGAWLAERVWEPALPGDLASAGYEWTVLDDNHLRSASVPEDAMWGTYTTDDQGELLTIFGTEQRLRYLIPFGEVEAMIDHLRDNASEDGHRLGIMGDDGEKFGAWPNTFDHCWGKGQWIERCFSALEENADWLTTTTPSAWLDREPPLGRIYVPTSSYVEMSQWVLPTEESNLFGQLLHRAQEQKLPEARFLRGGFWRNFQRRYSEVNSLHKQMLRASRKADSMPDDPDRDRALDHLYQGQSNDCYWHGLFGGIYIVHMRMATLAHLIAAEDLADTWAREAHRRGPGGWPDGLSIQDFDLDGLDEALLATPGQVVMVDPATGGGISSWDLRASRVALASVVRRRPEAYHQTLIDYEDRLAAESARAPAGSGSLDHSESGALKSIHDIVTVKEPGLSKRLQYDAHERLGGLVHILPSDAERIDADALRECRFEELGDFVAEPFELTEATDERLVLRRQGRVHVTGQDQPLSVSKTLSVGGARLDPWLELAVTVESGAGAELEFELALGWDIDLMGGGGNPAAYYELPHGDDGPSRSPHDGSGDAADLERLWFGNEDAGVRVDVLLNPPARATWYPIETISNSEAGFERIYQGSGMFLRWPMSLAPGATGTVGARFTVGQARDLRASEG